MASGGGGDYSREVIIFNIFVKGGGGGAIIRGRRLFLIFSSKGGGGVRLFEGGDSSRDGYYSRKYGISVSTQILKPIKFCL